MYHCHLRIALLGLPADLLSFMQLHELPERFTQNVQGYASIAELPREKLDVLIYAPECQLPAHDLAHIAACGVYCIAVTAHPEELPDNILAQLWDVWPPLAGRLREFYVRRLYERLKEEKDAWLVHNYWQTTINMVPDLIWYKDKRGAHLEVNDAFCHVVGKTKDDIRGRGHYYIWDLTEEQYKKGEFVCNESEIEVLTKCKPMRFDEHVLEGKDMRQLSTYKSPLFDLDGQVMGTVGVAHDVTHERALMESVAYDSLGGVRSRTYFFNQIEKTWQAGPIVMIFAELSRIAIGFEAQHTADCDELMSLTGKLLQQRFPDSVVARMGGEEFAIVHVGTYDGANLHEHIQRLFAGLDEQLAAMPEAGEVSLDLGIAVADDRDVTVDELTSLADRALYRAKVRTQQDGMSHYELEQAPMR